VYLTDIERLFAKHQLSIADYRELPDGYGIQFYTDEGPIVNIYRTDTVNVQGKNRSLADELAVDLRLLIKEARKSGRPPLPLANPGGDR
jgi:predicted nucleotide-binding protein